MDVPPPTVHGRSDVTGPATPTAASQGTMGGARGRRKEDRNRDENKTKHGCKNKKMIIMKYKSSKYREKKEGRLEGRGEGKRKEERNNNKKKKKKLR